MFAANVNIGVSGSGIERGLEGARLALTPPMSAGGNAGFLRNDADLVIIFLSDEEDQSPESVAFYEGAFAALKPDAADTVVINAIVGTQQPRCTGPGGSGEYGARYIQIAQGSGGFVDSICGVSWGASLGSVGLSGVGLTRRFTLHSFPVPNTIAIEAGGAQVPSTTPGGLARWVYEANDNAVVFQTGSVPQSGATISVSYTVACLP